MTIRDRHRLVLSLIGAWVVSGCVPVPPDADGGTEARLELAVHDVSFLFPYPQDAEAPLLRMVNETTEGPRVLLAEPVFALLGQPGTELPFLIEAPGRDQLYPALRVVAARIDPCFEEIRSAPEPQCTRQVRLSAQAWVLGGLTDASVHLFYELDDAAFVELLRDLRPFAVGTAASQRLGVHPTMAAEGLAGPTAAGIRAALLKACSTTNLTRFTFMATGRSKNWFFHSLERSADGSFQPNVGEFGHSGFSDHGTPTARTPAPLNDPLFPDALLTTSELPALPDAVVLEGIDKLMRLASPTALATSEVRCSSCHAVDTTLRHVLEVRGLPQIPDVPSAFEPAPSVAAALRAGFGNHHAFSYFGAEPTVSMRAENESHQVATYLSSDAFLQTLGPELRARLFE